MLSNNYQALYVRLQGRSSVFGRSYTLLKRSVVSKIIWIDLSRNCKIDYFWKKFKLIFWRNMNIITDIEQKRTALGISILMNFNRKKIWSVTHLLAVTFILFLILKQFIYKNKNKITCRPFGKCHLYTKNLGNNLCQTVVWHSMSEVRML